EALPPCRCTHRVVHGRRSRGRAIRGRCPPAPADGPGGGPRQRCRRRGCDRVRRFGGPADRGGRGRALPDSPEAGELPGPGEPPGVCGAHDGRLHRGRRQAAYPRDGSPAGAAGARAGVRRPAEEPPRRRTHLGGGVRPAGDGGLGRARRAGVRPAPDGFDPCALPHLRLVYAVRVRAWRGPARLRHRRRDADDRRARRAGHVPRRRTAHGGSLRRGALRKGVHRSICGARGSPGLASHV
ncbi:MAG: hypothetical protein AVDCRST_MAG89-3347, partial [uncultured Gemmatimonadetes bacterium]